jgi:hypothetical protein
MDKYSYDPNTPFAIRLELLKLAQSIESERIWSERNRLEMDWQTKKENGVTESFPELPSVTYKSVIAVAEELNKFVSNKG